MAFVWLVVLLGAKLAAHRMGVDDDGNVYINSTGTGQVYMNSVNVLQSISMSEEAQANNTVQQLAVATSLEAALKRSQTLQSSISLMNGLQSELSQTYSERQREADLNANGYVVSIAGESTKAKAFQYDGSSWSSLPDLNEPRFDHAAVLFNNKIHVIGGRNAEHMDSMEIFDGTSWKDGPSMDRTRFDFMAVVYQGCIYALGGYSNGFTNTAEKYCGQSWSSVASFNTGRNDLAAAVYDDKIYIVGGTRSGVRLDSVQVYSGSAWSDGPSLLAPRKDHGLVVYNGVMYAIGGTDADGNGLRSVEAFDGVAWTAVAALQLPSDRSEFAAVVYRNTIHLVGAVEGNAKRLLMLNGSSWVEGPQSPSKFYNHAVVTYKPPLG